MVTRGESATPGRAPLTILRVETVLSRFPIHTLAKTGGGTIHIRKPGLHGTLDTRWEVSYNTRYGPPRQLAYKLDTLVINQQLDALGRPLPTLIRLGSLAHMCRLLGVDDGGGTKAAITTALHQNAGAYIVATLCYQSREGRVQTLDAGFHRYSVILTGEQLPNGTKADAVYLLLDALYRCVLNQVPVRPIDYTYLKALPPMAQRAYELVSFKLFAALKHRRPTAKLGYAEYCLCAPQQRYVTYDQVKKQMYKVHRPHLAAGYFAKVQYEATTDEEGRPDWLLHYTPGPKARAEYAAFMRHPGADAAAAALASPAGADQEDLLATVTRESLAAPLLPSQVTSTPPVAVPTAREATARLAAMPEATPNRTHTAAPEDSPPPPADPLRTQAEALVRQFYQRFHGLTQVTPSPKELAHATELLVQQGEATAHALLEFSHHAARETQYQPQTFMGILHYLPRALAAYETRATLAITQRGATATRRWQERYIQWRQATLAQLRAALPAEDLAALEAGSRTRLLVDGTPLCALGFAVRMAVDEVLEAQAGLPTFEVWRQTQEAGQ